MENWQIWYFLGLTFLFLLGLLLLSLSEEDEQNQAEHTEAYSKEDLTMLDFLETRQAVNEDFLKAQNLLLKELFNERRRF